MAVHSRHVYIYTSVKPNPEQFVVHPLRKVEFIITRGKKGTLLLGGLFRTVLIKVVTWKGGFRNHQEAGEMAPWIREFAAFPDDPSSVPHNQLQLQGLSTLF